MGKSRTTVSDILIAMAIVLPMAILAGVLTGLYGQRFGLTGSVRAGIITGISGLSGVVARAVGTRRVNARSAAPPSSGVR